MNNQKMNTLNIQRIINSKIKRLIIMKKKPCFILLFCLIYFPTSQVFAGSDVVWKADLTGVREDTRPIITIGVAKEYSKLTAPPVPPEAKCDIFIQSPRNWMSEKIKQELLQYNGDRNFWIIGVNPHMDVGLPPDFNAACIINWNSNDLGEGNFMLIKGYMRTGDIEICDMKKETQYTVSGRNKYQYFTILNSENISLEYVIQILKYIVGMNTKTTCIESFDYNDNNKIGIEDAVYVMKHLAQID